MSAAARKKFRSDSDKHAWREYAATAPWGLLYPRGLLNAESPAKAVAELADAAEQWADAMLERERARRKEEH